MFKKNKSKLNTALENCARENNMVVLYGHKDDDLAVALFADSEGKLHRFTVKQIKDKRAELGLEEVSVYES